MNFPRPFAPTALLSAGLVLAGCGNPFGCHVQTRRLQAELQPAS